MRILKYLILMSLVLAACKASDRKTEEPGTAPTGPKTSYGQAMEKARGASGVSDSRNDAMKKQADELMKDN